MRAKYSIGVLLLAAARVAAGATCPPALEGVAREVAALRQVPPPFSPPCRVVSPATLKGELERKLRRDLPVDLELFLEALRRLGFIEGDVGTLVPRVLEFYRSQVLGFYEPQGDEMVLVEGAAGEEMATLVWAHELAHAAQERRFQLPSRLLRLAGNGDAQRAASAIAEGEALLVMLLLAMPRVASVDTLALAEKALAGQLASQLGVDDIPAYFVEDLVFPYEAGFSAVLAAYRQGGWGAVDRLLATPPSSTAELVHPDRPLPPPLGDEVLPPLPDGYDLVLTDTLGEWGVAVWLARVLDRDEAFRLATAWRGDRLLLARSRRDPGRWALAWELACGDENACTHLARAFQRHAPTLLKRLSPRAEPLLWQRRGGRLALRAGWPAGPEGRDAAHPSPAGATRGAREISLPPRP